MIQRFSILTLLVVGSFAPPPAAGAGLEAGAAAIDISPQQLPAICNGGFLQRMADRVDDPLHARALVLRAGGEMVALCVVDSCMLPTDVCAAIKAEVKTQVGLTESRILISATHTHTAPGTMELCLGSRKDEAYTRQMIPQAAEAIVRACRSLRPAAAGWVQVDAHDFTCCRRYIRRPDRMIADPFGGLTVRAHMHPGFENPDVVGPSGPADPQLSLLSVVGAEDRAPICLLANFSMHYFGAGPGFSADFCGDLARLFEADLGGGAVGIVSQGTSGDLMHMDYSRPEAKMKRDTYAAGLAKIAIEARRRIEHRAELPLGMAESRLALRRRTPAPERLAWAAPINATRGNAVPRSREEVYAEQAGWLDANPGTQLVLQAIRLGDLGITAIPNEVFGITGLKLKHQSPLPATFNIALANGAEGYIPPPEQHRLGGYTTWPARTAGLEELAEPKITESVLMLLEKVSGRPRRPIIDGAAPYSSAVLEDQPVAYWRLNDLAGPQPREATGQASAIWEDGAAFGLPGIQRRGGAVSAEPDRANPFTTTDINRAAHVAGGRLRATMPRLGHTYSVEFWVWNGFPDQARPITGYLFSRGPDGNRAVPGEHLGIGGTHPVVPPGRLFFFNGNAAGQVLHGQTRLAFRDWHHVVMVREADRLTVYLDGRWEFEGNAGWTLPEGANDLFLGGRSDCMFGLEGKLDEVALYPAALTAAQVTAHFQAAERSAPETGDRAQVFAFPARRVFRRMASCNEKSG